MDYNSKLLLEKLSQEIAVLQKRIELLEQKVSLPTYEMQSALSQKPHTGLQQTYTCINCILFKDRLHYFFKDHTLMATILSIFFGALLIALLFRVYGNYL